ncbi:SNF2-related protein [Thermomonospora cellulosilytica]|uniref:Superfamily II DNA or RNA helicase n=1 Tax=Thermomonospora cellulosilytica TaxID=1411118 RepID=A0A7W3R8B1_9ACTN|nr:SNF2-related protein [Thermomonospora cellulosilytica]MBA9004153.1 superfamily II DNA or RNA helicase [Thermomonospora cellulosilytica]
MAELETVGGRRRFRVFHSATLIQDYFEDQLQPVQSAVVDEWANALAERRFVDLAEFRARLTATRLGNPQVDHLYALTAARIQFIPFQFKPLLRMLRAERPRLLIADDVGVGKTIEAGLVLKELSTRQRMDNVLVLCPKALTGKWRAEMRRFDEDFRVLSARELRYCLDEVYEEGRWPQEYSRAIVHYELFRMEQYLQGTRGGGRRHLGLLELSPSPQFNLVIADEAHHLRTPASNSYRLIEKLCQTSEAVLMLSATPVQVHSDNLFTLLNLLRPDLFPDKSSFQEILEPNRHLTKAVGLLRSGESAGEDWQREAATAVAEAGETSWGRKILRADPRYQEVVQRLGGAALDDEGRVRCIRDLEELHSLAHVMNRTRRRDIGRFTVRDPQTVQVPFTDAQRAAYEAVLAFRREVLLQRHDPRVVRLIMDVLERQAASCITVLRHTLGRILDSGGVSLETLTDDPEIEDEPTELPAVVRDRAQDLLVAVAGLSDEDPKFERLRDIVSQTLADPESPGKVLVFSSFLNTIDYLRGRLAAAGVRVGVVTGQVADREREELRDRFRLDRDHPDAIDVLLSSEVGCEGLDYEFCDRLVNYDIPWNPMRIEQRIGRVDRFGQRSDKVLIFNFITPDTVEERVFFRCFDRLGVFRDSVGDLEEVLGEAIADLNRVALDASLSPEQTASRARQIADNAIRLAEEQRRLDDESGWLIGLGDAFTAEVEDVVEDGRFIDEADLGVLVESFLRQPFLRGRLERVDGDAVKRLRISENGRVELASRIRSLEQASASFVAALEQGRDIDLTLRQKTAVERRDLEFLTPVHPLAKAAAAHWTQVDTPLVGAFRTTTDLVPAGVYVFACEIWETIAARPDLRLVSLVVSSDDRRPVDPLSRNFLRLLTGAGTAGPGLALPEAAIAECLRALDAMSDARRRVEIQRLQASNDRLLDRRLASLDSFHENRHRRVKAELEVATEPRIARMKKSELAGIEADHQRRRTELERARRVEILSRRVAIGLLEVTGAG